MTVHSDPAIRDLDRNDLWSERLDRARQMLSAASRELGSSLHDAAAGAQDKTRAVVGAGGRSARTLGTGVAARARRKPASTALTALGVGAALALLLNGRTRKAGLSAANHLWRRYGRH